MKQNTKIGLKVLRAIGLLLGTISTFLIVLIESVFRRGWDFWGWVIVFVVFLVLLIRDVVKLFEYVERLPKNDSA